MIAENTRIASLRNEMNLGLIYLCSMMAILVARHDWSLHAVENGLHVNDGEKLKLDNPERTYATEPAPNGKQLRVYYRSGVMYVAYNSN